LNRGLGRELAGKCKLKLLELRRGGRGSSPWVLVMKVAHAFLWETPAVLDVLLKIAVFLEFKIAA
jgi:hypothetical protein